MSLPDNALTTVAAVCAETGGAVPAPGSAALVDIEGRIGAASDAIEGWCGRPFGRFSGEERVAGYGTDVLCLEHYPLGAIVSIGLEVFGGDPLDVPSWFWRATPDRRDAAAGLLRHLRGAWQWTANLDDGPYPGPIPGQERRAYVVNYAGGYVLPKDATPDSPRTLPYDLERACVLAVTAGMAAKGRDPSITSESILSSSVSYAAPGSEVGPSSGLPLAVEATLSRYRRVVTCG